MNRKFVSLVSTDEAESLLRKALVLPVGIEIVETVASTGRLLVSDIVAEKPSPAYSRSAMDGFAVRASDLTGVSEKNPGVLEIAGEVLIGNTSREFHGSGICVRVPTGGAVPEFFDTVVPIEHTTLSGNSVVISREFKKGSNIDASGSDYGKGQVLLKSGIILRSKDIAVATSAGVHEIPVLKKIKVGVSPTGNELVPAGSELEAGKIYDSNGPAVIAAFNETGLFEARHYGIINDEREEMQDALRKMIAENDLVVTTGGTSAGDHDLVYRILGEMKPGIIFHGVAVKPGMPTLLAVSGKKPVIGLPGPSVSAMMILYDLFLPALYEKAGFEGNAVQIRAVLESDTMIARGRKNLIPVALHYGRSISARPVPGGSGRVSRLSEAQGYFTDPGNSDSIRAGTEVMVFPFSIMPV